MKNKKGFTLVELITVIVILGILMLIAIPSVTKHIDNSKKETYVRTLKSLVKTVDYGILSGDENYKLGNAAEKTFSILDIEVEKGDKKSPYGNFVDDDSFVKVVKRNGKYSYYVQAKDTGGYCVSLTSIKDLTKNDIKKCDGVFVDGFDYSIGDLVSFAGSHWRVIKNSSSKEDYVTLMKEKVLTNAELGDYGMNYTCQEYDVISGKYGCTTSGQIANLDMMAYYYSDTCHSTYQYGYGNVADTSGCNGYSNYDNSKIKEFLDGSYINVLGINNLKEVDGYKIRLITLEELQKNFGYATETSYTYDYYYYDYDLNNTPSWIYQDFGNSVVKGYWTMTKNTLMSHNVYVVNLNGRISDEPVVWENIGVRPVINLLKTSIN